MIQIYTGKGKGKTTAALGLTLRALGANFRVCFIQFMKKGNFSEVRALKKFKKLTFKQFGREKFVSLKNPSREDILLANKALKFARKAVNSKKYDLVVLDEINVAVKFKLIKLAEVIELVKNVPLFTELILTGRYAHGKLIKLADLVTEMQERKHYFRKGKKARKGIEY